MSGSRAFGGRDACVTPVLSLLEAAAHPQIKARGTYLVDEDGFVQPAPAPRFAATPVAPPRPPSLIGADTRAVFSDVGLDATELDALFAGGALG